MAAFPPGLRFIGGKIGLPGFKPGQKWASPTPAPSTSLGAPDPALTPPIPPPSATAAASAATSSANQAAARQRKRAAAGNTLLANSPNAQPVAKILPRTLLGG